MGHFPSQRFILTIFMSCSFFFFFFFYCVNSTSIFSATHLRGGSGEQPLSKIAIHNAVFAIHSSASITASPFLLGKHGEDSQSITVKLKCPNPSEDDWVGVFSPANFNSSTCPPDNSRQQAPYICSAPIKYKYANESSSDYTKTGNASLKFILINQRADFSFGLFTGGLSNMTVTWTSGYNIDEAVPFVEWGFKGEHQTQSPAGTLTFHRNSMCGSPARTVGWRDPGFIHTSFLKELWPNSVYTYKLGHRLFNGSYIWSKVYSFKSSPYPGQDSLQRIIVFGDLGKAERDGSNEYSNYQPGSLNTTDQLIKDLDNFDIVFHIGDLPYANGYISQWDQFTSMVEPIASTVPYMIARYSTDYGMFHFCIADTEHDWREGTEQYKFIEHCLASADRQKQPWLIFAAHRVLGYSSDKYYALEGSFEEPMGRESLQKLWQKYKNQCVNTEKSHYSGTVNGTIHVVVGGGGSHLSEFSSLQTPWSLYRDYDFGFVKLTAFNHSSLLFEYKKSSDGKVYDSFTISRDYRDVLACVHDGCEPTTLAT
ncbi:hypothetical protein TEA_007910 [Camellia sinensis var. sinensis]|uniref:Purple acid phosphatase n=1 Tax=Camellia sinensis var. sinensis TaxID=542762 RepID=A0A4S4E0L7_CAMSN|nr:hypothetical protein TEA_007910 [Camellia sinensis var. sinensis]